MVLKFLIECDIPTPCGTWKGVEGDPANEAFAISIVRAGDSMLEVRSENYESSTSPISIPVLFTHKLHVLINEQKIILRQCEIWFLGFL